MLATKWKIKALKYQDKRPLQIATFYQTRFASVVGRREEIRNAALDLNTSTITR
jgi:hypothetical protein